MPTDMDERELEDAVRATLARMSGEAPTIEPWPGLRRGLRRRVARTVASGAIALALVTSGSVLAIRAVDRQLVVRAAAACDPQVTVSAPPLAGASGGLTGITLLSSTDAWAVGPGTLELPAKAVRTIAAHWDGRGWSRVSTPNPLQGSSDGDALIAVSAAGPNDVWAVGATLAAGAPGQVNPLIEHWDGSAWSQVAGASLPDGMVGGELEAVAAVSADDVWAVGYAAGSHPLIEHWDGRTWSLAASPDPSTANAGTVLSAVSATSAKDAWAVGDGPGGTFVVHWDGAAWSQVDAPGSPPDGHGLGGTELLAVAAIAPDDAWAAGNLVGNHRYPLSQDGSVSVLDSQPYFLHWDGQGWTKVDGPPWSGGDVTRISALAASGPADVWAAGLRYLPDPGRYEELVLHWNGTAWTQAAIEESGGAAPNREMIGAASAPDGSAWFAGIGSDRPFGLDGGRPTPVIAVGACSR